MDWVELIELDGFGWYLAGFQKTLTFVSSRASIKWVWLSLPVVPKVCTAMSTGLILARFDTNVSVFWNQRKYVRMDFELIWGWMARRLRRRAVRPQCAGHFWQETSRSSHPEPYRAPVFAASCEPSTPQEKRARYPLRSLLPPGSTSYNVRWAPRKAHTSAPCVTNRSLERVVACRVAGRSVSPAPLSTQLVFQCPERVRRSRWREGTCWWYQRRLTAARMGSRLRKRRRPAVGSGAVVDAPGVWRRAE